MPELQRDFGWAAADVGTLDLGGAAGLHRRHAGVRAAGHRRPLQRAARVPAVFAGRSGLHAGRRLERRLVRHPAVLARADRLLPGRHLPGGHEDRVACGSRRAWARRSAGWSARWCWAAPAPHAVRAAGAPGRGSRCSSPSRARRRSPACCCSWRCPNGRARAASGSGLQWRALASIWTDRKVRASVFGYFGHMWELYTMWVLVPAILATRLAGAALSWAAFVVLAAGAIGCIGGGAVGAAHRQRARRRLAAGHSAACAACSRPG